MTALSMCCNRFAALSRAAARAAGAKLRSLRLSATHPRWAQRAAVCESCPLRVIRCGVSYCGPPLLDQIDRDPAIDGCGCPCHAKAKSPSEHCPLNRFNRASETAAHGCTCKWCDASHAGARRN